MSSSNSLSKRAGHNIARDIGLAQQLKQLEQLARQLQAHSNYPVPSGRIVSGDLSTPNWELRYEKAREEVDKWKAKCDVLATTVEKQQRRTLANFSNQDIEKEIRRRLDIATKV